MKTQKTCPCSNHGHPNSTKWVSVYVTMWGMLQTWQMVMFRTIRTKINSERAPSVLTFFFPRLSWFMWINWCYWWIKLKWKTIRKENSCKKLQYFFYKCLKRNKKKKGENCNSPHAPGLALNSLRGLRIVFLLPTVPTTGMLGLGYQLQLATWF